MRLRPKKIGQSQTIQNVLNKRKKKTSGDGGESPEHDDTDIPEVDLLQLQVNSLQCYK